MVTTKGNDTMSQLHLRMPFKDHEYHTMHDGELILFNLEDYQPYEPENCLHEAYLFCDIIIDDKPVDHYALTASQYDAMTATVEEGSYYEN
tara:strand:+ start:244 stop:516 length:273 start_codon:yes stop_codon:yes gene_type:complete